MGKVGTVRRTALAALVLAGCGGPGTAVRPEQPTAANATGRSTIKAVDGPATPLIVDWKAEQRADLEEVIHDGVAIVAWKDDGLHLLKRCRLKGEYGYLPIQVKKDVVRLESAEDVAANLPLGGIGIAGKIGGEFERGTTLDIAMAMVGKRRTTWADVAKDDLKGDCGGATHYVRAILVGAFSMQTGAKAKVRGAAEIFGAGVSGGSSSSKGVDTSDGKLEDCEKSTGDEAKPPGRCQALLRLELEPILAQAPKVEKPTDGGKIAEKPEVDLEKPITCPATMVFAEGKCTKPTTELPHVCSPSDPDDCEKQCDKGNARSCNTLGVLVQTGKHGAPDRNKANGYFEKACKAGLGSACTNLGFQFVATGKRADATRFLELGCGNGDARGCGGAGDIFYATKDFTKAMRLYEKGCNGGSYGSCTQAGYLYSGAVESIPRDDVKGLAMSRKACYGGDGVGCGNAGLRYEFGMSVPKDLPLATALFERACKLDVASCFRLGILYQQGEGVPKDEKRAKELYDKTCSVHTDSLSTLFCHISAVLYGGKTVKPAPEIEPVAEADVARPTSASVSRPATAPGSVSRDSVARPQGAVASSVSRGSVSNVGGTGLEEVVSMMKGQCDQKNARACSLAGAAEHGLGHKPASSALLKQACDLKDAWGCDLRKRLK